MHKQGSDLVTSGDILRRGPLRLAKREGNDDKWSNLL